MQKAKIGLDVIYHTDGRNGLDYELPAKITCTRDSHPGDYPDGEKNPLTVPETDEHVHLTVFTPGGFGAYPLGLPGENVESEDFKGADGFIAGSGTYVELNVKMGTGPRTWRWPVYD